MGFDLQKELNNNENDKIAIEAQVEKYKKTFADELVKKGVGKEMSESLKYNSQPVKLRKPFKLRVSEKIEKFKNKLKIVLGVEE
jgi:hypothetical protein